MTALALPPLRAARAAIIVALLEARNALSPGELVLALDVSPEVESEWTREEVMLGIDDAVARGAAHLDFDDTGTMIMVVFGPRSDESPTAPPATETA